MLGGPPIANRPVPLAQRSKKEPMASSVGDSSAVDRSQAPCHEPGCCRAMHSISACSRACLPFLFGFAAARPLSSLTFQTEVSTATARTPLCRSRTGFSTFKALAKTGAALKPITRQALLLVQKDLKPLGSPILTTVACTRPCSFRRSCQGLVRPSRSTSAGGSPLAAAKATGGLGKSKRWASVLPEAVLCQQSRAPKDARPLS
mmetsp:Transcript_6889/g.19497  ORF Transcript_6889/g.19497 Transcript_6889/m.19497 type:complete len:204 (-) Transcript_6889:186-797(-)